MSIGIKELAILIGIVLLMLELRRAQRFARSVQTRVATGAVNTTARVQRFRWLISNVDNVPLYIVGAICLVAFALLITAYLVVTGA